MKALLVPADLSQSMRVVEAETFLDLVRSEEHNLEFAARLSSEYMNRHGIGMLVDEDGAARNLPANYRAMLISQYIHIHLRGDVLLVDKITNTGVDSVREDILEVVASLEIDEKARRVNEYNRNENKK